MCFLLNWKLYSQSFKTYSLCYLHIWKGIQKSEVTKHYSMQLDGARSLKQATNSHLFISVSTCSLSSPQWDRLVYVLVLLSPCFHVTKPLSNLTQFCLPGNCCPGDFGAGSSRGGRRNISIWESCWGNSIERLPGCSLFHLSFSRMLKSLTD